MQACPADWLVRNRKRILIRSNMQVRQKTTSVGIGFTLDRCQAVRVQLPP
jgi:hypothetical protein